jgi:hypothetical protein
LKALQAPRKSCRSSTRKQQQQLKSKVKEPQPLRRTQQQLKQWKAPRKSRRSSTRKQQQIL